MCLCIDYGLTLECLYGSSPLHKPCSLTWDKIYGVCTSASGILFCFLVFFLSIYFFITNFQELLKVFMLKTSLIGESARNHRRYVRVVSVNAFDEIQHCREVYQLINLVKAEHIYLFIYFRA